MVFTFRERKGLWKLIGNKPLVYLHIGEPLLPDLDIPRNDAIEKLHKEAYHIMQVMAGVNPGDPTYNTNQDIDSYKKTM